MPAIRSLLPLLLTSFTLMSSCSGENTATTVAMNNAAETSDVASIIAAAARNAAESTYQDLEGRGFELSDFAGKKVFVNYWATWCAPCIREIPALNNAAAALESENFVFLLASDEKLETITNFLTERQFSGNFVKLNGYFGAHGIVAVPSSLLYDEQGNLVQTWAGAFEWDTPEMLAEIRAAVAAPAP